MSAAITTDLNVIEIFFYELLRGNDTALQSKTNYASFAINYTLNRLPSVSVLNLNY